MGLDPTTTEFRPDIPTDSCSTPWVQLALIAKFVQLLQLHLVVQCWRFIFIFAFICRQICFKRTLTEVITLVVEWIDAYAIHLWRVFRNGYRKFSWVEFSHTTTELHSDALTDWAIRLWVILAPKGNFVQLLQFHLFLQCSRFISNIPFVNHHVCIKWTLAQVITLVAEWIDRYGIHHWRTW